MQLTSQRLNVLSEISKDIAQVFFASILIDPLVAHTANWPLVITGLILATACWLLSLYLI